MPIGFVSKILEKKPYPGRLMGLDHGTKRTGVAVSDPMQSLATPVATIEHKKFSKDIIQLKQLFDEYEVKGIVLGLPLNMDGTEGPRCDSVRDFARNLVKEVDKFGDNLWIGLWDERLSSSVVEDFLITKVDANRRKRAEVVDKLAAQHILQGALDTMS